VLTMEEGEAHKTLETANDLVTQLLDCGAKRDSLAVVVGGGVVGDTAGFAAAIFLRGIDLVHVPTTLLAQVDSSLGGKVAVNHPKGKNLIGAFHPPRAVIADLSVLESLPERERLSGLFEAAARRRIDDAIRAWKPPPLPPLSAEDVLSATEHDKKNTGSARIMVLPEQIGRCAVAEVTEEEIRFGIQALGV